MEKTTGDRLFAHAEYLRVFEQEYEDALDFYELAVDAGMDMAANNIGSMYYHGYLGTDEKENMKNARLWYRRAMRMGNATACLNLIEPLMNKGLKGKKKALEILIKFLDIRVDPEIINKIGEFYYFGDVVQDDKIAFELFLKAKSLGYHDNYFLGLMYLYSSDPDIKNEDIGLKILKRMSKNGDKDSTIDLLKYYYFNNNTRSMKVYQKRCEEFGYTKTLEKIKRLKEGEKVDIYSKD